MDTTVDASARPHGGHGGPPPMPSHSTLMIDGRALLATRRAGTTTRTAGEGVAPGVAEAGAEEEEEGEEVFAIDGTLEETLAYHVEHPPAPLPSTTALASARVCADAEGCDPLVVRRDELVLPLFDEIWRALLLEVRPSPPPLVLCASGFSLSSSSSPPPPTKELRFWFFPACSERSLATAERSSSSSSRRSLSRPVLALSLPSRSRSAAAQLRPLVRRFVSRGGLVASKAAGGGGFGGEASDGMQGVLFSEW